MDLTEVKRFEQRVGDSPADILRRARALIDEPEKLATGGPYRDGCRLCSLAAVEAVGARHDGDEWKFLCQAAITLFQTTPIRVSDYSPHHQTMRMWDYAIALAEQQP